MFDETDRGAMLAALVKQLQADHDAAMTAGNVSAAVSASKSIADLLALALPKQVDAPPPSVPVKLHLEWGDGDLIGGPREYIEHQLSKYAAREGAVDGEMPSDAGSVPGDEAEVELAAEQLRAYARDPRGVDPEAVRQIKELLGIAPAGGEATT
jgi:GTP cyclohydrolase II